MPQKKHKPEEIVAKLRQVDVLVSQGQSVAEAVRSIGVTQFTYYRWRKEFGGLKTDQVKRLKELELKNKVWDGRIISIQEKEKMQSHLGLKLFGIQHQHNGETGTSLLYSTTNGN
jgi:ACT domain-containing protein